VELVEGFLSGLSDDYQSLAREMNEDFLVDKASAYLDKVQLTRMVEGVESALEKDDVEEARQIYLSYERIDFSSSAWKDPLSPEVVRDSHAHYDGAERLIQFDGALETFLGPHFKRGDFVAFAGPDKRGKSYWLGEIVWRALRRRYKVLWYVLGDMDLHEASQRLQARALKRPWREDCEVNIPLRMKVVDRKEVPRLKHRTEWRKKVSLKDALRLRKKLLSILASTSLPIRIRCEGGSIVSAGEIEQEVQRFSGKDWVPDVVVIDYADPLLAEPHTKHLDLRHQINATWMILRRIALRFHCLVVTATQTATTAYDARVIRKKDFSEDKRKNAHVTGMVGINQTDAEKMLGVYRLNWIVLRGGKWSESQMVWTAGDLSIACPCLISALPDRDAQ